MSFVVGWEEPSLYAVVDFDLVDWDLILNNLADWRALSLISIDIVLLILYY